MVCVSQRDTRGTMDSEDLMMSFDGAMEFYFIGKGKRAIRKAIIVLEMGSSLARTMFMDIQSDANMRQRSDM